MRQDSVDTAFYKAVMATHEVNSPCINIGALAASKRPAHGQANGLLGLPQLWRAYRRRSGPHYGRSAALTIRDDRSRGRELPSSLQSHGAGANAFPWTSALDV
eukprot:scaffold9301_cov30-Tisochrysis_lutea.AAC.7